MPLERPEVEAMVRRFVRRVASQVPVDEVWLYGSYAVATPSDDSDIDVAIVSPQLGRDRWADAKLFGQAMLPDAVLVEAIGVARSDRRAPAPGSLLDEIMRTGYRLPM